MSLFGLLSMIGGLALFLYGMHIMSEGLEKVSGGRLEKILENLTSSKWKAVLLGAGVTAVSDNSNGSWFCKFRHYEALSGNRYYHGCQCGYYDHFMVTESDRYSGR